MRQVTAWRVALGYGLAAGLVLEAAEDALGAQVAMWAAIVELDGRVLEATLVRPPHRTHTHTLLHTHTHALPLL